LILGILSSLFGCVHAGPNVSKVSAVKSAAIIALGGSVDWNDEWSSGRASGGLAAIQGMSDINSTETATRRQAEAEGIYDALATKLGSKLGWAVTPRAQVSAHAEMQKLFQSKMGARRLNAGTRFGVSNVLWPELGSLSVAEQQQLKTALGVDVLVVAQYQVMSGRTYGVGAGGDGVFEVYPKSVLAFTVYDGGPDGAIWQERYVPGPNAEGKVIRTLGVVDTKNEPAAVLEAAQLATDTLLAKFDEAKAAAAAAPPAPAK
jgi:hypothetical protein